jgi:hypothetical protein
MSSVARRATVFVVALFLLATAAGAAQTGPFPPSPRDNNPKCHEDSVESPDSEEWQTLYKYEGNPLSQMQNGETRVLSTNPLITVTRLGNGSFDWTSSVPVVAVVVKASNTANIYYYSPAATSGAGLVTVGKHGISHIDWCVGTPGPTTTQPPVTTTSSTQPPVTTTSSTQPPATTTSSTQPPATTSTSTTEPPETTTSTTTPNVTLPPD